MMKQRVALGLCWLLCLSFASARADVTYRSKETKRLVEALQIDAGPLGDGSHVVKVNSREVNVQVANGQVRSVGYRLFSDDMKKAARTPILRFLERYFLALDYPETDRPSARKMSEDRFVFETGNRNMVGQLRPDDTFYWHYAQKRYRATWERDGLVLLSVSFPADRELVSGETKIEAENNAEADMLATVLRPEPMAAVEEALTPAAQPGFFIKKGGQYLNGRLTSDLYYQRQGSGFALLATTAHPLESAANLMLCPPKQSDCMLKVRQAMYGYKKKDFEMPLNNWVGWCLSNGCELFFGVESLESNAVKASVVAVNNSENYNHVLFVTIPLAVIEQGSGDIEARLETYIPMHNVLNLFDKNQKRKK